ncbi:hypothetical protein C5E46_27700 [Nocardia nova]|nr:hypothetical protein C5E46_27700 [Nocardia nova]
MSTMTRTRAVRKTSFTILAAAAIGMAPVAVATAAPESRSAADASATASQTSGPSVTGASSADPRAIGAVSPLRADQVSLLDLLPTPLNCLLSTGYALLCLGVPVP